LLSAGTFLRLVRRALAGGRARLALVALLRAARLLAWIALGAAIAPLGAGLLLRALAGGTLGLDAGLLRLARGWAASFRARAHALAQR
jgi:hypothetical protein